jgi:hypothetical protein
MRSLTSYVNYILNHNTKEYNMLIYINYFMLRKAYSIVNYLIWRETEGKK